MQLGWSLPKHQALQPPQASQVCAWDRGGKLFHRAFGGKRAGDENQKEENTSSRSDCLLGPPLSCGERCGASLRAGKECPGASWPACLHPVMLRALDQSVLKFSGHPLLLRTFLRGGLWCSESWTSVSCTALGILNAQSPSGGVLQCSGCVLRCSEPHARVSCNAEGILQCSGGVLRCSELCTRVFCIAWDIL